MQSRRTLLASGAILVGASFAPRLAEAAGDPGAFPVRHSEAEWRRILGPGAFEVLRRQHTERPWSSPLLAVHAPGRFACAGCNRPAFDSASKFDSGTGWPSFFQPIGAAVTTSTDNSFFMQRTEVHCATCGGHLGHVFDDGPRPTGLRYCINGVALRFQPA